MSLFLLSSINLLAPQLARGGSFPVCEGSHVCHLTSSRLPHFVESSASPRTHRPTQTLPVWGALFVIATDVTDGVGAVLKKVSAPPSHRESSNLPAPLSTFWLIAFWLRSSGQLESSASQREGRQPFPSVRAHEQNRSEEVIAHLEIPRRKKCCWKRASLSSPLIHKMLIKHLSGKKKKKEGAKSVGGGSRVSSLITKLNAL